MPLVMDLTLQPFGSATEPEPAVKTRSSSSSARKALSRSMSPAESWASYPLPFGVQGPAQGLQEALTD